MTNSSLVRFARFAFKGLEKPKVAYIDVGVYQICAPVVPGIPMWIRTSVSQTFIETGMGIEYILMSRLNLSGRKQHSFVWGYGPKSNTLFVWEGSG